MAVQNTVACKSGWILTAKDNRHFPWDELIFINMQYQSLVLSVPASQSVLQNSKHLERKINILMACTVHNQLWFTDYSLREVNSHLHFLVAICHPLCIQVHWLMLTILVTIATCHTNSKSTAQPLDKESHISSLFHNQIVHEMLIHC